MRCPKCQYISFDNGDRCRNCGYQFSLSADVETLDLPIQTGDEPEGPLGELTLDDRRAEVVPARATAAAPAPEAGPAAPRPVTSSFDLPLFGDRGAHDDRPLVSAPAVPRAPLSVRKAAPAVARPAPRRGLPQEPELDLGPPEEPPAPPLPRATPAAVDRHAAAEPEAPVAAPAALRLLAAIVDLVVIGTIDAAVLHFTLKLCGLEYREIAVMPIAPFAAFLLLLNGGYFAAFTAAGGQSIGKMIARVKVIPADLDSWTDRVPLGQAVLRSAAYLVSALPAGLGFLPALVGADKRAVHDRLAHTRVVKA